MSDRIAQSFVALLLVGSALFLTAGAAGAAQLSLSWVDNSGGTATFGVERKTGTTGTYARIGTTATGVATYADTTVAAGTTYCYRVMASSGGGNSGYSNEACGSLAAGFGVTVATSGTGSGSVVSAPAGITCPGTCTQSYGAGTVLTLTATPAAGSSFSSWSGGGCGGTAPCVLTGNAPATVTAAFALNSTAPTPSISSLSPSSVPGGSTAFSLTVTGSGFVSGATATVGGQARTVTVGSATQLTIAVSAADVARQGPVAVQVSNPAPCTGGLCASNSVALTVTAPTPAPTLSSISPSTAIAGGAAFTLTATGTNFAPTSVVRVNGVNRTTSFVGATQLTASIPASDIAGAGTATLTVLTPAPGGGTSGGQTLTVMGPSLTVNTASVAPGGAATATLTNSPGGSTDWLTLAQVGAADTSYLQWVYVGAGVTTRTWTINMPTTPGQYEFRFYPNNGFVRAATSPAVTVATVATMNPPPSIASLSPSGVAAGSAAFSLTVTGSGFVSGATATVGGQARTVTVGSATQLTIALQAADVASPRPVAVQISNPASCAGGLCASNSVALNVTASAPATLTLAYNGKLRDRVGQKNTALAPDGALDGTLTATLSASGGRTVTALRLDSNAPGTWDTTSGTGFWVLAVAPTLDGTLLNAPGTMAVNFPVPDGGNFVLFAADYQAAEFLPGRTLTLTVTFADGSTATAVTTVPAPVTTVPATLTLAYNGKLRDRVGQNNTALAPDGALDGTLTATLSASGGRTVTGLRLDSNAPGTWDTTSGTGFWVLAVAPTLDGTLLNVPGTMAVNFPVPDGGSFVLFASDYQAAEFLPGRTLTLTVTFSDGSTATAVTTVPTPATLTLAYNGKLRDRVGQGETALGPDGALDGTLTATLSASGGRTVTALRLDSDAPGVWDTTSGNGWWVLAVASSLDSALRNAPGTMAVNFPVPDGGSFVLFASDYRAAEFLPGRTLTLTATFADGSTATAVTTVP